MSLHVEGLGVWRPRSGTAFEDLTLTVEPGEAVLLAGRNGAGASAALARIAGLCSPGERRVGTVQCGTADLTGAHPDEVARIVALVGATDLPDDRTAGELVASASRRSGGAPMSIMDLVAHLGLAKLAAVPVNRLTGSERMRIALCAALARGPRVLLLDQVLGPLESRWKQRLGVLVRRFCEAGGAVLWVDQDLTNALPAVDRVVELGVARPDAPAGASAWRWRSPHLPWTPLQQVASLVDADLPGDQTVAGLRRFAPALAVAAREASPRPVSRGALVPVAVGDDQELMIDDTVPPVFLCDSARSARTCHTTLVRANGAASPTLAAQKPVQRTTTRFDRHNRLAKGTTLATLSAALPALRPASWPEWHSAGERTLLANTLALAAPSAITVLHEPFRYLDAVQVDALVRRIAESWLAGSPVLVVTTDVEAVARFGRVIVWIDQGIAADGRASAILGHLPALPLLAQTCAPHPIVDTADLAALTRAVPA